MFRWVEWSRDREEDQAEALRRVSETADRRFRAARESYDAFVEPARQLTDGLLLGTARSSRGEEIPIRLPWGEEATGHWEIEGGTGAGKTSWVTNILRQELMAERPVGLVDCKGDLFHAALRWLAALAHRMPEGARERLRERLVVIDPFADALVPLNVCRLLPGSSAEVQAFDVTLALGRLFDTALGLHMESLLRHLILLLIESQLSLLEAPEIIRDEVLRGVLASRSTNPAVREFFLDAWATVPQVSKDALVGRLQALLLSENVRLMLGADEILDLRGVLERGDPLFVFLGRGAGVPEEQVELVGNLLMLLIFQATFARRRDRRQPYLLLADEFFHLLDAPGLERRFATALTTARSFGLGLMLIHHSFAQLPHSLREILLANCDRVALFRTSVRNAEFFGDFLPDADPETVVRRERGTSSDKADRRARLEALQRLPNRCCYWYDRRQPYRAIRLRAPDVPAPHEAAGAPARVLEEIVETQGWRLGQAAIPRAVLQGQIAARQERLRALLRPASPATRPRERRRPDGGVGGRRPSIG
jgi:hypothetical protein